MYTINIMYYNGSMEINLENWIDYKPTKAEIRRVYKLCVESDRDHKTNTLDVVTEYIKEAGKYHYIITKNKAIKALAEVFNVSIDINKETPKKERKKDIVYPEHRHIKYGRYLFAIYADIYTYKDMKYGIYKSTEKTSGKQYYTLVEFTTSCKIEISSDKNYLIDRITDTYNKVVEGVSRMQERVNYVCDVKNGIAHSDITKSINTVTTLYKMNIITKEAYIDTISVFSKLIYQKEAA